MNFRSSLSFSVNPFTESLLSGKLIPLSALSFEPSSFEYVISTSILSCSTFLITPSIFPSSRIIISPGLTSLKISGKVQEMCAGFNNSPSMLNSAGSPGTGSL